MKAFLDGLYKSYMLKNAAKDVFKFVRENVDDIEWDKDYWLHRAGLSTYRPVKSAFGGLSLFLLGIAAGGAAALFFAPKKGEELRTEVKDKATTFMNRANAAIDEAAQVRM